VISRYDVDRKYRIPVTAKNWLLNHVGEFTSEYVQRATKKHTQIWRISSESGAYYFKLFRENQRFNNEVFAYRNWAAAYSPLVPNLSGVYKNQSVQGLLITSLDGIPLRKGNFSSKTIVSVYRKAGQLCRQLENFSVGTHSDLPETDDVILDDKYFPFSNARNHDPVEHVRSQFLELFDSAMELSVLEPDEKLKAEEALDQMDVFKDEILVPVNIDYTPGNWIVDSRGCFSGIIDLEHLSWNVPVFSLTRLITTYFPFQENGRKAFYDGYGRNLEIENSDQVKILVIMDGLRYLVRGIKKNNSLHITRGKNILKLVDGKKRLD